jgi:hypothetical protein
LLEYGKINHFTRYSSEDLVDIELSLIVGFGHTPYPADYRSMAAIEQDRAAIERAVPDHTPDTA